MGVLRDLIKFSIHNHYLFVAPMFLLEAYRDGMRSIPSFAQKSVISEFFRSLVGLGDDLLTSKMNLSAELVASALDMNHFAVIAVTGQLVLEKFYVVLTKVPRPTYHGMIGSNFHRWIEWHWLTIAIGVGLKWAVEHNESLVLNAVKAVPYVKLTDYMPKMWHLQLYLSAFLLFESLVGIAAKTYIILHRQFLNKRAKSKKNTKKE